MLPDHPPPGRPAFDWGTLVSEGISRAQANQLPGVLWDARTRQYRARAWGYRDLTAALKEQPGRVLLHEWIKEVAAWSGGPIGCWGDGSRYTAPVTAASFESDVRRASDLGVLLQLVVVDEVRHVGDKAKEGSARDVRCANSVGAHRYAVLTAAQRFGA